MSIIIDAKKYDVHISEHITEPAQLDKYAERTDDGSLIHEPIGTFYTHKLTFEPIADPQLHNAFWEDLNAPRASRVVTIPGALTTCTYECYIRVNALTMVRHKASGNRYDAITASFIPIHPARRA